MRYVEEIAIVQNFFQEVKTNIGNINISGRTGGRENMECARCDYYKAHNCKHQCMQLPEGKTCADCAHIERCMMMFHGNPKNTMCGWEPIKFKEIPCSWNDRQKKGCEEWCGLPFC